MGRDEAIRAEGFKAAFRFAEQAALSTGTVPTEIIEDAVEYGEALVVPGITVEDALQLEHALRVLKPMLVYRRAIEDPHQRVVAPDVEVWGLSPAQLRSAIDFARERGWEEPPRA